MSNNWFVVELDSELSESICREITADLSQWFGIPEANERYALGVKERTSFAIAFANEYIGMITIEFPFLNNANIYWMGVKKSYQNQGIGSYLLQYAEDFCLERRCYSLTVETLSPKEKDENYLRTYQFYINSGFLPLFELHTYGPDYLMVYLQKRLVAKQSIKNDSLSFYPATTEDLKLLDQAITDYNIQVVSDLPRAEIQRLDFIAKDKENNLLGGIQANRVNWGVLHIELLFVFESYRKAKIGSKLLNYVENIAREQGCYLAHLDTFDFQAKDFYISMGYSVFGILDNCPKGHCRYYLKKDLKND